MKVEEKTLIRIFLDRDDILEGYINEDEKNLRIDHFSISRKDMHRADLIVFYGDLSVKVFKNNIERFKVI